MAEDDRSKAELESFRENFRREFVDFVDLTRVVGEPMSPDLCTMNLGGRGWDDLTNNEKQEIQEIIGEELGLPQDQLAQHWIRGYRTHTGQAANIQGEIKVDVFRTNKEGVFLQVLTYEDGKRALLVGPDKNI